MIIKNFKPKNIYSATTNKENIEDFWFSIETYQVYKTGREITNKSKNIATKYFVSTRKRYARLFLFFTECVGFIAFYLVAFQLPRA